MNKGYRLYYSYNYPIAKEDADIHNLNITFLNESCGTNGDCYIVYKNVNDITVDWLREATEDHLQRKQDIKDLLCKV